MTAFDFDQITDRRGTMSLKYDFARARGVREDALPLWVADMDFPTAPCVTEALHRAVDHGIFGYTDVDAGDPENDYVWAIRSWYRERFHYEVQPDWLVCTPGVVFAIVQAIRACTAPGDRVLIQQPVYYPFFDEIRLNGRTPVSSDLVLRDGRYEIDFEDFERKAADPGVKLFLLCNPHNPGGRSWTREELIRLGEICLREGVTVLSDEIHSDFVFPGHTHQVFAGIRRDFELNTITCTAPTKTFNLAGLQISNIFIASPALRRRFLREVDAAGYSQPNVMGLIACRAAYEGGAEWLEALKLYLRANIDYVRAYVDDRIPGITAIDSEATYLVWLDCRGLGLSVDELEDLVQNGARLWLDSGRIFGKSGEGFQRINCACPRSVLERAMDQLRSAVEALRK